MCGDGTIPSPFNRTSIPSHRRAFKNLPLRFLFQKCQRNTFLSRRLAVTSQNIYSLHTPAKGILCDPPLPLHIVSNPRHLPPPAGATADGLVNPDHVSLQEFCPALSQQLQGQCSSSRSTSTADPTRRCITPRWSAQKHSGEIHTRGIVDRWWRGYKKLYHPTFMQCMSNCVHGSSRFLWEPTYAPPSILASATDA